MPVAPRRLPLVLATALVLLAAAAWAEDAPEDPPVAEQPTAPVPTERAPFAGSVAGFATNHANVELTTIAHSRGKRPLRVLTIRPTRAGRVQPADEITWVALLVAGLAGDRPAEEQRIALDTAWLLAEAGGALPLGAAVQVIIDANPDASAARASGPRRGNDHPVDDDGDGKRDEDGPEDLDGDGVVSWMRYPDRAGALHESRSGAARQSPGVPEFADPDAGKPPTHGIALEGKDDDLDGAWNEDGVGGVDLSRNFPWRFDVDQVESGGLPISEPTSKGIFDLIVADERIAVVCELGAADVLTALPPTDATWIELPKPDVAVYEQLRSLWNAQEAAQEAAPGTAGEGVVPAHPTAPKAGSLGGTVLHQLGRIWVGRAPLGRSGPMWPHAGARWPEHLQIRWEPIKAAGTPPGAELARIVPALRASSAPGGSPEPVPVPVPSAAHEAEQIAAFIRACAGARATLEFVDERRVGTGGLLAIWARVQNTGKLPTHLERAAAVRGRSPVEIRVVLPEDAQLIAGSDLTQVKRLAAGEKTEELRYVVSGTTGAKVIIEVTAPDTGTVRREYDLP